MGRSRTTMNQQGSELPARLQQLSLGLHQQHIMEEIVSSANVKRAWQKVRANRGAPGVDGVTLEAFPDTFRPRWPDIKRQLLDGTYAPQPVRRRAIPKPSGGQRLLGIPTVLDRLIQQAVLQVLTPRLDPEFSESSYGFRPRRSAHGAVKQVRQHINSGAKIVVDMDLEKFFDRVHHDILMARVARRVVDRRVLQLIGRFLRAGVLVDGMHQPVTEGTPQGGPLSPLLANILLDDLDKELEQRGHRFVRYADDFLIFVRTTAAGRRVKTSVTRWLRRVLRLSVNETKSRVAPIHRCNYLGFAFSGSRVRLPPAIIAAFKQRVRWLTGRSRGISWERRLNELNAYLRGWVNYYGICTTKRLWTPLDEWIRRRLRMCLWKQWRHRRTRIRNLLALGTSRDHAVATGSSRKGHWRLSKTPATQSGLTNAWFDSQGLIRLRYRWGELAPLRRTA